MDNRKQFTVLLEDEEHIRVRVAQACLYTERKQPTQGETEDAVVGQ